MTVMQSYSLSLTYTSLRVDLPQAAPRPNPASPETRPTVPPADMVTLSPEAQASPGATEAPVAAPEAPPAPASRAARRAEVLLDALDADQDGAVTKQEFLDGAMALLRRAGARHRHHHHDHDGRVRGEGHERHGHEGHGMRRLERKLDRLFERVDASDDGNVDHTELTSALARVTRERRPNTAETAAPSVKETPQAQPAVTMSYTSVSVVVAVKQYTSVAAMKA